MDKIDKKTFNKAIKKVIDDSEMVKTIIDQNRDDSSLYRELHDRSLKTYSESKRETEEE